VRAAEDSEEAWTLIALCSIDVTLWHVVYMWCVGVLSWDQVLH